MEQCGCFLAMLHQTVTSSPPCHTGVYCFAIFLNHLPVLLYTVKYAGCDLIPYIPLQIRAVSVQDYPGNSCKAASPQLISQWMSRELSYALEWVLQTTVYHSLTLSHLLNMFDMQNTWLGFSDNVLSCICHGHGAPVTGARSCLSIQQRAAECKCYVFNHGAIIMQQEFWPLLSFLCSLRAVVLRGSGTGQNQDKGKCSKSNGIESQVCDRF